ncbi:3-oxoacyl-[acyl-carrier protein] reductase [Pseudomonas linyingensis]|uniref:3-oxoacyl-[acyl-carrier protein] reductase n=1 Tax=Pseudomonas linyingensis TaxID=915471 RepID=A0A1H7ASY9_9PSED|nr:SDR family NAD(P)-dependent oxidoreductase [Pseudomonas linyingensis]SEJ64990.1 3-oxoacyl-[acyl-carrier protein] reductase [Pseudomonas linyingensis]
MAVAMVTGAGGAIGSAACRLLAAQGYRVAALDLAEPATLPAGAWFRACDVSSRASVAAAVEEVERELGEITALVNVAGVVSRGSALDLDEAELQRVLRINVQGTLIPCQLVGRRMAERGRGAIVNIGSVVGKNGGNARPWLDPAEQASAGNVAYGMSKAAVHSLTQFLAKELASRGVRVNAVAPGPIATDMTTTFPETLRALIPLGRMGRAEEVAEAVAFLLSDKAGFISGEILDINGALWCD